MKRRDFMSQIGGASLLAGTAASALDSLPNEPEATEILLPTLAHPAPLPEVVLFAFDNRAFPFQNHVETHLTAGRSPRLVLRHGSKGSHEEVLLYYGTVLQIGGYFHLWYNGNYGPQANNIGYERVSCVLCYARSRDGVNWEKPSLGLVEFQGSKENNICDFPVPSLWSTAAVLHDPDDPDPNRRFKIAYEARYKDGMWFSMAFSPDGLSWQPSPRNPTRTFLEMAGVTKFRGLYYVYGHADFSAHAPLRARRLTCYVSDDFEHWSPCSVLGLDRTPNLVGPSTDDAGAQWEEIHLGAGLWNRGNVLLGIYGQWHGHFSGDRRWIVLDLGLAISHDALHFYEPIPSFRIVPAREQPDSPRGVGPALMQGQGMENVGNQTYYWYGLWRGTEGSGVRLATWPRDRLGMLRPFLPQKPRVISCLIQVLKGPARIFVNASGLGRQSYLRIGLLTEGFRPISGYSDEEAAVITEDGLRIPVRWKAGNLPPSSPASIRVDIRFEGSRPEDAALHAIYVANS
jgi:hypothetical protein